MARKYDGTLQFTEKSVGPDCDNKSEDVETVQQLLQACGELTAEGARGGWGGKCTTALQSFCKKYGTGEQQTATKLAPNDELLLLMAQTAKLVMPLSGLPGMAGVKDTHKWFEDNKIRYNEGAQHGKGNRAVYGVHGNTAFAVETISTIFSAGPMEMDCTVYVNLMLSIYFTGNLHGPTYKAFCGPYGGTTSRHLARERYGFPLVMRKSGTQSLNYFSTAAEIAEATKSWPASVYVLEVGEGKLGGVKHMALLNGSTVYECTTGQPSSSCISRSLDVFMSSKAGKIIYLFGPK
jgi:hypothetical protein